MNYSIEVITLPVSDADRAMRFYTGQAGFVLDVDYRPNSQFRVVQLTPPGSSCSVQFGIGVTDAAPGSTRSTCLVVTDIEAAHRELTERGLPVSPIRHKTSVDDWQGDSTPGTDPERRNYASLFDFADPDGNTWIVQERGFRVAPLVQTEAERVSGRVEKDAEGLTWLMLRLGRTKFEHRCLGGIEIVDDDVEMHLLGYLLIRPSGRSVVLHRLEADALTVLRANLCPAR